MYPKFRGLWYLVGREFRTSRRPLNVASVRARTVEQATKYQSPRSDGTSMPRPSERRDRTGAPMAGKPQTLATTSAFEILGPVMVGPSSSHTAGALRCAQVAASLLEGRITKVTFGLWNSFAHTYRGHGTDRALVAGILGLDTDDENIKQAFDLAREQGLEYHFGIKGDDASIHPNTVDIDMVDDTGATAQVRGESLGGGKMRISRINGVGVDISGMYSTLFVAHQGRSRRARRAHQPARLRPCKHRLLPHLPHREWAARPTPSLRPTARPTTPSSPCSASSTMSITRPLSSSPVLPRRSPPASRLRRSSTTASSCSMRARNWDSASVPSWPFARHV